MATHHVPTPAYPLIGRRAELRQIEEWLEEPAVRVVTITGPGGIGKTRVAQEVGLELGDPVWVALEDVPRSQDAILARIGQALELPQCSIEEWHTRLDTVLPDTTVVVLDNMEHLREQARQLTQLLNRHPQLRFLVTSRVPLLLAGERLLTLEPLEQAEAVRMLVERAQTVRSGFEVDDHNETAVAELCRRLDGIPLCLELAAARLRHLGPGELAQSLEQTIELLSGGGPDRPERHQTLAKTLDWSYGLLESGEQALFAQLSVFVGGFERQAVEAVTGQSLEMLLSLTDHNLVSVRHTSGQSRYFLLETVRSYAAERCHTRAELADAHARYYYGLAEELERWRGGQDHPRGLQILAREKANLSQALRTFAETERWGEALRLAGLLGWYWEACSLLEEGREAVESVLPGVDLVTGCEAALALHSLAVLLGHQGDYTSARGYYQQAGELWETAEDHGRLSETLSGLGQLYFRQGDYEAARNHFERALELAQRCGQPRSEVEALNGLGRVNREDGRLKEAVQLETDSLVLAQQEAYPLGEAWAHNALGEVYRGGQDHHEAARHFRLAAERFRDIHEFSLAALALQNLAYVELSEQRWQQAGSGFHEALTLWKQAGARHGLALCLIGLAGVMAGRDRHTLGARLLGAADELLDSIGVKLEASDRQDYIDIEAGLHARLGAVFQTSRGEGAGSTVEALLQELSQEPESLVGGLTAREVEVLRVTATGASNKEIADQLSISPQTVMVHLRSIFRKLDVTTRTAAARRAAEIGI